MTAQIKRAVISATNFDDALFPFTRVTPKELLPLGNVPIIQRLVDEAVQGGAQEIVFLLPSEKRIILNHFSKTESKSSLEKTFRDKYENLSFQCVLQKKNIGNGYAVYKTREKIGDEPFFVSFSDNVFSGKKSSLEQLYAVYRTSQKSVVGLKEVRDDDLESNVIVETEKIANRFYKIKKVISGAGKEKTSSRMALSGRYVFIPGAFDFLKENGAKTDLVYALNKMIGAGKTVYGHECEGEWFSLKDQESFFSAQRFFLDSII